MVTVRAPCGAIAHQTWSAFLICAAQLILTQGLYWHLIDDLHLTIAMTPCITPAQMLDNITVEDMVRLFAGDGITIPQISDTFEWGQMALAGWSTGSDASRRMEAMQAMILTCEQTSHNDWDRPVPLEPRWWWNRPPQWKDQQCRQHMIRYHQRYQSNYWGRHPIEEDGCGQKHQRSPNH